MDNDLQQRLERIKRAMNEEERNPEALAEMGELLLLKGLAERATQFLERVVELDPENPRYHELYAQALRQKS